MSEDALTNPTAESALLGAMLLRPELISQLADHVRAEDFAWPIHERIFNTMLRFAAVGKSADAITLRPIFANDADANYGEYLDELVDEPALASQAEAFADQIAEFAGRRRVRDAMRDGLTALTEDFDKPVDEITGAVEAAGYAAARRTTVDPVYSAGGLIGKVIEREHDMAANPSSVGIMQDMVPDFDKALGALEPSYNIIAARPGMGKSALASSLALGWGLAGACGVYIQHEMTAVQMGMRVASDLGYHLGANLPHKKLRKGGLDDADLAELRHVEKQAEILPVRYLSPGRCDVRKVWSLAAQEKAKWEAAGRKMRFVVVDYLQLLGASDIDGRPIQHDTQRINAVSAELKRMSHEMELVVIALAQLSRMVEARPNKRPILSDLKGSGDIEQDADSVTLLYREEYYLEQARPKVGVVEKGINLFEEWEAAYGACRGKMDLIIAKNRHDSTSTRTVKFVPAYSACRGSDFDEFAQDQRDQDSFL